MKGEGVIFDVFPGQKPRHILAYDFFGKNFIGASCETNDLCSLAEQFAKVSYLPIIYGPYIGLYPLLTI